MEKLVRKGKDAVAAHNVAAEADGDGFAHGFASDEENGNYVTPYDQVDIDAVLKRGIWSVVSIGLLPRQKVENCKDNGYLKVARPCDSPSKTCIETNLSGLIT